MHRYNMCAWHVCVHKDLVCKKFFHNFKNCFLGILSVMLTQVPSAWRQGIRINILSLEKKGGVNKLKKYSLKVTNCLGKRYQNQGLE